MGGRGGGEKKDGERETREDKRIREREKAVEIEKLIRGK